MSVPNLSGAYPVDGSDHTSPGYKGQITGATGRPDDGYDAARFAGSITAPAVHRGMDHEVLLLAQPQDLVQIKLVRVFQICVHARP